MFELKNNQIKSFKDNGYLVVKSFFKSSLIKKASLKLKSLNPKKIIKSWTETEPGVPLAVYSALGSKKNDFYKIASSKKILKTASQLMNEKVYVWHSKINVKDKWAGTAEYYHQDQVYWRDRGYKSDKMLSCMIPLDKHNSQNAGLKLFKKSHKLGFIKHEPFININGLCKFMLNQRRLDQLNKSYKLIDIDLNLGDVLFFHSSIVHGSSHNSSGNSRSIILSQLNTHSNLPSDVKNNAIKFNLKRAKFEFEEEKKRLNWFKKKYYNQKKTNKIIFSAPIPSEEKQN